MRDLHPQAHDILAFSDNRLGDADRQRVERLLADDESAADFLVLLKASNLPFDAAFNLLLEDDSLNSDHILPEPKTSNHSKWLWPTSLVASLLLGATLTFFILGADTENHDNWIVQVADYHLLYVRETVSHSQSTPEEIKQLSHDLGAQLDTKLTIPNLSKQNLDFRRGQILDSNGRKLVQLAYLPKNGRPVALCILKENITDSLPKTGISRGLPYVTWSKKGLSYVIIGDIDKAELNAAAMSALSQMDSDS